MRDSNLLYKYVPINESTLTMLNPNTLKFTLVSELNDIYDCKVMPSYKALSDDELWELFELSYPEVFNKLDKLEQREKIRKYVEQNPGLDKFEEYMERGRHGVLSMSKINDSILMWGHYADKYKGMCIGYNKDKLCKRITVDSPDIQEDLKLEEIILLEVNYKPEFPEIKPKTDHTHFDDVFLYKYDDWDYEEEVRFIRYTKSVMNSSSSIVKINDNIIESITFGPKTDSKYIDLIQKITLGLGIKFYKTKKVPRSYKLEFERIN